MHFIAGLIAGILLASAFWGFMNLVFNKEIKTIDEEIKEYKEKIKKLDKEFELINKEEKQMSESYPQPTEIRPITGIKQVGNKVTIYSNGKAIKVPAPPIYGTLDVKTGIANVLDYRNEED